jgi:hypothetical protein
MIKYLLLILFVTSNVVFADCEVYQQIITNKPNIDKEKAKKIAKVVKKVRTKYKIPKGIIPAILMQESSYRLNVVNKDSSDYGMSQINHRTIAAFDFDKEKLMTDLEYSIEAAAIVLNDFKKRHAHKDPIWFARYNHSNPEIKYNYFKKLLRWMPEQIREKYEQIENK